MTRMGKADIALWRWQVLAVLSLTTISSSASATDGSAEAQKSPSLLSACIAASGGVTSEMRSCLQAEYIYLDRQLNLTYKAVRRELKAPYLRKRLVEAQRAWVWRRDHDCRLKREQSPAQGGTVADLIFDDCRVEAVRERIEWLYSLPVNLHMIWPAEA